MKKRNSVIQGNSVNLPLALSALGLSLVLAGCGESDTDNSTPVDDATTTVTQPVVPTNTTETTATTPPQTQTPSWINAFDGSLIPNRGAIIGNDEIALIRSSELDDIRWLTAVNPGTGEVLWRLPGIEPFCAPAISPDGNVLVHLSRSTAAAGNDQSDDLTLVDALSGEILDQWQPEPDVQFPACSSGSGGLKVSSSGIVVHSERGTHHGFRISDEKTIELVWQNTELDLFASYEGTALVGDNLFVTQQLDRGDDVDVVFVNRIDALTGVLVNTFETEMRNADRLQVAGPDHLALLGTDVNRENILFMLTGVGADSAPEDIIVTWTRKFDGDVDGITFRTSNLALSEGAFASWSKIAAGSTVTEFDLATGMANWSFQTSSFSNNDTIAALPAGGYVVGPFGGNFLEATTVDGNLAWAVDVVPEANFPSGFAALGENNIVVATEGPDGDGWVVLGVSTLR